MLIENFNAKEIKFIKVAVIACDIKNRRKKFKCLKNPQKKVM